MIKPKKEFRAGDDASTFTADDYASIAEYLEALSSLSVVSPITLVDNRAGRVLAMPDSGAGFWAKLSGAANPYGFTEMYRAADYSFAVRPGGFTGTHTPSVGDLAAYESNAVAGLANTIQWLVPGAEDDFRFQDIADGGSGSHSCGQNLLLPPTLNVTYSHNYNSIAAGGIGHPATYSTTFQITYVPANTIPWMRNAGTVYNGDYWAGEYAEYPTDDDANLAEEYCHWTTGRMYLVCGSTSVVEVHRYMTGGDYPNAPYKTTLTGPPQSCLLGTLTNTTAGLFGNVTILQISPYHGQVDASGVGVIVDITT